LKWRAEPPPPTINKHWGNAMNWIEPAYCDVRLGFEVTAYVFVR
jgi:coenzyme PQQ precursor peptide PqqA